MVFQIIFCIIIIGAAVSLGLRGGIDWLKDRGKSWGESYMKDYGLYEDKKDEK